MHTESHTEAIVLSGGGSYAAYEVGVMKALATGKVPCVNFSGDPAVFTGTSAGAINASMLVSQLNNGFKAAADFLEEFWLTKLAASSNKCDRGIFRVRGFSLLDFECVATQPLNTATQLAKDALFFARDWTRRAEKFISSDQPIINRALAFFDLSTLFNIQPLMELIAENILLDKIRNSRAVLKVASTNWQTGGLTLPCNADFTDEDGHLYIVASAAIPGIFPPVDIKGEPHVDGGVVMNTPLKPAIDAGASILHVIYMDPDVKAIPLHALRNTLEVFDRLWVIQNAQNINNDIENARRVNFGLRSLKEHATVHQHSLDEIQDLLTFVGQSQRRTPSPDNLPFRELTIHRYHPSDDLGSLLGAANLQDEHIIGLISQGFEDALNHNCETSECINPPMQPMAAAQAATAAVPPMASHEPGAATDLHP